MSFGQAFAAARHEVGANGAFVWHGQVYTTYYAEEWETLSPEEQKAFSSNAIAAANGHPVTNDTQESLVEDGHQAIVSSNDSLAETDFEVEVAESESGESGGVEVVEENVVTDDGYVVNIGVAEVEGHNAVFIDGDADGTFDLLAVDVNDDGYIDADNELMVVDNPDLNVDSFSNDMSDSMDASNDGIFV